MNSIPLTFTGLGLNSTACCDLSSAIVDVTSIVKPIIDTGLGGQYDFNVIEGSNPSIVGLIGFIVSRRKKDQV